MDSYDNALAESVIGLYKTELIRPKGPWRNLDQVEYATPEYVDWFNTLRQTRCGSLSVSSLVGPLVPGLCT